MKFIDEAVITVKAGDGGRGAVSFRREKFAPRGGPDGGDGGNGGDVVLVADPGMTTLLDFKYRPLFKADSGEYGRGKDCYGRGAEPLIVPVPSGTAVFGADSGELLTDLVAAGDRWIAARGGRGGRGNIHFKSATNRAPRHAEPGRPGEESVLRLELKLIADVGLVGLPNAGKSTLISRVSAARPKIADYPFTTLVPQLGVVSAGRGRGFVVADLPGLIQGASQGHGLGHQFLKHIERTRLVLHLVDCQRPDPVEDLKAINEELTAFKPELLTKPQIVVITKADLVSDRRKLRPLKKKMEDLGHETHIISAVSGAGVPSLISRTAEKLSEMSPVKEEKKEEWQP